jgi:antitoxin MazE
MESAMQIAKWGNSLAVRLPKALVEKLGLKEGDDVEVTGNGSGSLLVERSRSREGALKALRRLRKYRGMMPVGWKFNRDEANER